MADGIPDGISRNDVETAIADFDAGSHHEFAPSIKYDLVFNGKRYPPKAIIGLAARRIAGRTLTPYDFKGGEGSRCFRVLRELDFDIVLKSNAEQTQFAVVTENDESAWHDEVLTAFQSSGAGKVSRRSNMAAHKRASREDEKMEALASIFSSFPGRPRSAIRHGVLERGSSAGADERVEQAWCL